MTSRGYQFARDLLQLHDATASDVRLDDIWGRELLGLWEDFCQAEWYPDWAEGIQTLNVPAWRIIPARKAVPEGASLLPAEDLESILDRSTKFAVVHCACRRAAARCDLPLEVCLQLNRGAEYVVARGTGRELTREEAMDVLDGAVGAGLIHSVYNLSQAINVSAYGGFLVAQQTASRMLARGSGAIFFTGASASVKGYPNSAAFAMGKFALRGLAQSMARELGPQGIHVAHFIIDGGVRNAGKGRNEAPDARPDSLLDPDAIAATYMAVLNQPRSAWTWEVELRPWVERF